MAEFWEVILIWNVQKQHMRWLHLTGTEDDSSEASMYEYNWNL